MKTSLQLAYIIGTYPLLTTTFIDREIKILQQLGADIHILSIRRPPADTSLSKEQQELRQSVTCLLPVRWFNFTQSHLYFALLHPRRYFKTLVYLLTRSHPSLKARLKTLLHFGEGIYAAYLLRHQSLDHLHAHFVDRAATLALVVGRLLDLPYSVTAHANDIYKDNVLLREKLGEARFVVTVSEFNKSHLLATYPGQDADEIHVLHPWVDLTRFQSPAARPASSTLHILSVGRLVEKKGHGYLIEACCLLQKRGIDFECRIIGDGPLQSELEESITRHGLQGQVQLLGAQPPTVVLTNLARCDVFALACVIARDGDRDGMPVALAEAMAMAVPVISCQIVGIDELVRPQAGLLVPPRDAVALADALQTIYNTNEADRAEMGRYGRSIVEAHFNLHEGVRQLLSLFQWSTKNAKSQGGYSN
jgi:colanic acid/amylovoran biosynthesis glycosyltransferase